MNLFYSPFAFHYICIEKIQIIVIYSQINSLSELIFLEAFIGALFLTPWNLASFDFVKDKATVDACMVCPNTRFAWHVFVRLWCVIHISVGSALLVLTKWVC